MTTLRSFLFITLLFLLNSAFAQDLKISGTLFNASDQTPLVGAAVKLVSVKDTLKVKYTTSDAQGTFLFDGLTRGPYKLVISYIGFQTIEKMAFAGGKSDNIGKILVAPTATDLKAVDVNGSAIRAEQKGDTTQYNAGAFKVSQDATTEDLIKKMPGITIENGTVKAHGEEVKKVLVDGKQFFGDDPSVTLKNLPAEVVDKIQVFDKLSDQAAWTGFDDGSGQKAINIVTKNSRNTGKFGKFSAGYGLDDRYLLGANLNLFEGQRRITLLAMSNNVNQQNFSADDLLGASNRSSGGGGGGGRPGMGGFGGGPGFQVGPQSGIFSTHALGFNFTNSWGTKLTMNASYFWNKGVNNTDKLVNRQYILGGETSQYYQEESSSNTDNMNHRFNMRLEYSPDTNNSFILSPRFSLQDNNSVSLSNALNSTDPLLLIDTLNSSVNNNNSKAAGYNFNNDLLYRHRFLKRGRTISVNFSTGVNNRDRNNYLNTESIQNRDSVNLTTSTNQYAKTITDGLSLSSNLVYTEPTGKNSQVQLNYNISYSKNNNDKKTSDYDPETRLYNIPNDELSNVYDNDYITHRIGPGYSYQTEKINLNVGVNYQFAKLAGNTTFPFRDSTDRTFENVLPNLWLNYKFSKLSNLRMSYRVSTNAPSVTQLQNVIDNSNPLLLSTGNPNLDQEVRHFAMTRFSHSNKDKTANLFGMLFFQKTLNYIGNSTYIASRNNDTLRVNGQEVVLSKGAQISNPKNLDGAWNTRALVSFGFPINPIKCNLNFNTGVSYNRLPSLINDATNISNTYGYNLGGVLSSNISETLDFTITYNVNYNQVDNSLQPEENNNYLFQIGSVQFNWEFWKGFFVQNSVTYQNYQGISSNISNQYTLWNLNIGKRLFKNKAGEIKLSGYDLLDQNKSLSRTVTDTYIEDSNTDVLRQYFMLSFTYNLRKFNGKMPQVDDHHHDGRFDGRFDGRPPGPPPQFQ